MLKALDTVATSASVKAVCCITWSDDIPASFLAELEEGVSDEDVTKTEFLGLGMVAEFRTEARLIWSEVAAPVFEVDLDVKATKTKNH